jgi:hypothetical protein
MIGNTRTPTIISVGSETAVDPYPLIRREVDDMNGIEGISSIPAPMKVRNTTRS